MSYEDFLAKLDPKVAKAIKTAQTIEIERFPVASAGLTNALGGGLVEGRLTVLYGANSCGKSTLMLQTIGNLQKQGKVCAWVDTEGSYDPEWAERLGVNNEELIVVFSKTSGGIEKEITPLLKAGIDLLVVDSISDIMPEVFVDKSGELNNQEDRKQIGAHAKALTAFTNGLMYSNHKTSIVFISQVTTKMEQTYVKLVPHGGNKVQHVASQVIRLNSSNTEKQQYTGEEQVGDLLIETSIGRKVEYIVEKNKVSSQGKKGLYDLYYAGDNIGIDYYGEVVDAAETFKLLKKAGAWYTILETGEQFQGRANLIKHLREDEDSFKMLYNGVRKYWK